MCLFKYGGGAMLATDIIKRFRVKDGDKFRLADIDPTDKGGLDLDKDGGNALLGEGAKRLGELQEKLYAEHQWAILIILQGLDAAGKDGVISRVMAAVNPQGCDDIVQGAEPARARPRFFVASLARTAAARAYRHLQPILLRGSAGGAR